MFSYMRLWLRYRALQRRLVKLERIVSQHSDDLNSQLEINKDSLKAHVAAEGSTCAQMRLNASQLKINESLLAAGRDKQWTL